MTTVLTLESDEVNYVGQRLYSGAPTTSAESTLEDGCVASEILARWRRCANELCWELKTFERGWLTVTLRGWSWTSMTTCDKGKGLICFVTAMWIYGGSVLEHSWCYRDSLSIPSIELQTGLLRLTERWGWYVWQNVEVGSSDETLWLRRLAERRGWKVWQNVGAGSSARTSWRYLWQNIEAGLFGRTSGWSIWWTVGIWNVKRNPPKLSGRHTWELWLYLVVNDLSLSLPSLPL